MDASSGPHPQGLVLYSEEAALDLAEIHTHTTRHWGWDQAERYTDLLKEEAQRAAELRGYGNPIDQRPGRFLVVVKWPGATYAHRIIYQRIPEGVYVLRILHSARDLPKHLGGG
ncbi:type II toxin-antitoxin system RelE/ParE family toxin [Fimbriimonas ginsengisoli]|uniref:Plasmid stabilization system n=1 Tax=Fimbriimonas ginsengisoli Gsoil 348 TaxID=661478 RepID=A0A068NQP8_FIMGI|nr:plasmid stabilization system [Fimbriimonas ginsengisoli Gsoil 348]